VTFASMLKRTAPLVLAGALVLGLGWRGRHRLKAFYKSRLAPGSAAAATASALLPGPRPSYPVSTAIAEPIFVGGRSPQWQDWGWAPHDDVPGGAARVDLSNWGGWQLARQGLTGDFGGLTFRFKPPAGYGDFLTVHLENEGDKNFPALKIDANNSKALPDGWLEVTLSMDEINPDGASFDKVVFFVSKSVPRGWTSFDRVALVPPPDPKTLPPPSTRDVAMKVSTGGKAMRINPLIYGIAVEIMHDDKDAFLWRMGATARRWGGNTSTRYNWQLGDAWNTANDWFFENVVYASSPSYSYASFLRDDAAHHVASALTIPMIGWVAKDTTSVGFPRAIFGGDMSFDPGKPEAGNGVKNGKPIAPGPPTQTCTEASPAFMQRWVEAIRRGDGARGARSVDEYILDNEPALWSSTHRDVHPEPLGQDELLSRTIAYASAIRAADPDAVIAGPAEWGWTNYLYSAKDSSTGVTLRPDRRAHGDAPLVAWYLKKLKEEEDRTGKRLLDVLDLHFYPQAKGVYGSSAKGKRIGALRIRSTRALWDPAYVDESWIAEPVMLIPRMRKWVAENYPGRGISIGEWNFGGEDDMSGAIAIAEALGRFGQEELTSAYYWTYPKEASPGFWAFRAYRNFDGKGGRFEDLSLPTTADAGTSLFASRSQDGARVVLVLLNQMPDVIARAHVDVSGSGALPSRKAYVYAGGPLGFAPGKPVAEGDTFTMELAPRSITVVELRAAP